jgi:hypothetical protein
VDAYYADGGALVADPNNSLIYWSGGDLDAMAVSKTTNAGITWTRYTLAASGYTYALAVDPSNSNIVYAGGNPGMYKTTNSGGTWIPCSNGLSGFVYDIAINPVSTNTVYAATPNGVFKTTNSGSNWTNMGCSSVNALIVDPDNPSNVYAGTSSGVLKSTDAGGSWSVMNDGLDDTYITSLDIYPGTYLYCGTSYAGMFRWLLNVGISETRVSDKGFGLVIKPNPTNTHTSFCFFVSNSAHVSLVMYDATGQKVRTLVDDVLLAGNHITHWDGKDSNGIVLPAGVYFSRLQTDLTLLINKVIIVK